MKSTADVAKLVVSLFDQSGQTRGRMSEKTISRLAELQDDEFLNAQYYADLIVQLSYLGILAGQLPMGGFGMLRTRILAGAKAILPKDEL